MGGELIVLGIAFLLSGLLARTGGRLGLPTIPLFVLAGIAMGPNTPGPVLFERPEDIELLAAFGLIFLLFYLGVEFSVDDLTSGGRRLLATAQSVGDAARTVLATALADKDDGVVAATGAGERWVGLAGQTISRQRAITGTLGPCCSCYCIPDKPSR